MLKRIAAGLAGLALITACAPTETTAPAADTIPAAAPTVDRAACEAKGGEVKPVCRRQMDRCVIPYPDAGKECTDGSQCAGDCLSEGSRAVGAPTVGRCEVDDDPCGCKIPVVDGKVGHGRCVD